MPTLGKPQLPPFQNPPSGWPAVKHLQRWAASLVGVASGGLQGYLNGVHNQIIPKKYASAFSVTQAMSPYTVSATDEYLAVAASAGAGTTVNLPVSGGTGRILVIKKTDSNAQNVSVVAAGSDQIDGAANYQLTAQYNSVKIVDVANGQWLIEAKI